MKKYFILISVLLMNSPMAAKAQDKTECKSYESGGLLTSCNSLKDASMKSGTDKVKP